MAGEGIIIHQYSTMANRRRNPDWRYEGKNRTEVEDMVKARSSSLMSKEHFVVKENGKKLKFKVTESDIEHLVSDALGRAKGTLYISDIPNLGKAIEKATFAGSEKDSKTNKGGVIYHYYEIKVAGRKMYLNIKEDKKHHKTRLHSITTKIKNKNEQASVG